MMGKSLKEVRVLPVGTGEAKRRERGTVMQSLRARLSI